MSEPKRYQPVVQCVEPSYQAQMIEPKVMEFSEGEYVLHFDYARLKAEVEQLKDALNKLTNTPANVDGVMVDVSFWTKSGSRLPSSFSTFWMNEKEVQHTTEKSPSFIEDLGDGVEKHDLKFRIPPTDKQNQL
jgi:hypothetical protein